MKGYRVEFVIPVFVMAEDEASAQIAAENQLYDNLANAFIDDSGIEECGHEAFTEDRFCEYCGLPAPVEAQS